jgi:hypothetical protein
MAKKKQFPFLRPDGGTEYANGCITFPSGGVYMGALANGWEELAYAARFPNASAPAVSAGMIAKGGVYVSKPVADPDPPETT